MSERISKQHTFLKALAYIGQFAALFPLIPALEVLSIGAFIPWHFAAVYGVWLAFWTFGLLAARFIRRVRSGKNFSKKLVPIMNLLLKIGFLLPTALFITGCVLLKPNPGVYFCVLLGGIVIYFGGCFSLGKAYSDIFSRTWFALYMISSIIFTIMFALSVKGELAARGGRMLCFGFAFIILVSALLTNQTNIDTCTNQRDRGRAVLPWGLRRYNALLGMGIFAVALGLFAFAVPIANFLKMVGGAVVNAFLYIAKTIDGWFHYSDEPIEIEPVEDPGFNGGSIEANNSSVGDFIAILMIAALIVLIIVFRKRIVQAIKNFFAPLFKDRRKTSDVPFADEITSSAAKPPTERMKRKEERELERRYDREASPERKYRLGYELFLLRLAKTSKPPKPSDTTDVHREKGESAFGEDMSGISETYNRVRYADVQPTSAELAEQFELLRKIR